MFQIGGEIEVEGIGLRGDLFITSKGFTVSGSADFSRVKTSNVMKFKLVPSLTYKRLYNSRLHAFFFLCSTELFEENDVNGSKIRSFSHFVLSCRTSPR